MTDPTGRSFVSYRRTRSAEAQLLIAAQHDHGIPTWQDVRDLPEGHTEDQLREVLADPLTANGVMWLTPEVADSPVIRRIEAPGLVDRLEQKDAFFVVPVVGGGLSYADGAGTVDELLGVHDLTTWNLRQVHSNPLDTADAAQVARWVLQRRIGALHHNLPSDQPLSLGLFTRTPAPFQPGHALLLDWSHRFEGREAIASAWQDFLLPALRAVTDGVQAAAPGRRVVAHGLPAIPAALALGCAFLSPRMQHVAWRQYRPGVREQEWSLDAPREPSGFIAPWTGDKVEAEDLAVLVSVAENVEHAFAATRKVLPPFRGIVRVSQAGDPPHIIASPGEAVDIAHVIVDGIRAARRAQRAGGTVHLFMAVPAGLAMLVGQLLNTFGRVQTYEHIADDAVGYYRPAALLAPANA